MQLSNNVKKVFEFVVVTMLVHCAVAWGETFPEITDANWCAISTARSVKSKYVNTVLSYKGKLFVGGTFDTIGPLVTKGVAQWDGDSWGKMGKGIRFGSVNALAIDSSGNLFAGGQFDSIGNTKANNIAVWNGHSWASLDSGWRQVVWSIAVNPKNQVFIAGTTSYGSSGSFVKDFHLCILSWDGAHWVTIADNTLTSNEVYHESGYWETTTIFSMVFSPFGDRFEGGNNYDHVTAGREFVLVNAIAIDNSGRIYVAGKKRNYLSVGGGFDTISCVSLLDEKQSMIMTKDIIGTNKHSPDEFKTLAIDKNGRVFIGGSFNYTYPVRNNIMVWDGNSIKPLGSGTNGPVRSLSIDDEAGVLYVGGQFDSAGNKYSPMIAAVDLYNPAAVKSLRQKITQRKPCFRWRNSTLLFSDILPNDDISCNFLSGRCISQAQGVSAIKLTGIAPQPLFVRVSRAGKIVSTGMVMVE